MYLEYCGLITASSVCDLWLQVYVHHAPTPSSDILIAGPPKSTASVPSVTSERGRECDHATWCYIQCALLRDAECPTSASESIHRAQLLQGEDTFIQMSKYACTYDLDVLRVPYTCIMCMYRPPYHPYVAVSPVLAYVCAICSLMLLYMYATICPRHA